MVRANQYAVTSALDGAPLESSGVCAGESAGWDRSAARGGRLARQHGDDGVRREQHHGWVVAGGKRLLAAAVIIVVDSDGVVDVGATPDYRTYPIIDSYFQRSFGVGVRHRGGAACMQITSGSTYTAPTINF
jgi:hypothetical protein